MSIAVRWRSDQSPRSISDLDRLMHFRLDDQGNALMTESLFGNFQAAMQSSSLYINVHLENPTVRAVLRWLKELEARHKIIHHPLLGTTALLGHFGTRVNEALRTNWHNTRCD